ncbi:glycosyl hydrolase family 81-domain-containing protein, partial [Scheffersomyces xylosifermentans]|uniref:glycosyl hydrolase family 81-domain-containing protein n=1 Tax=Scheffersomyces xylosifermentans TaxID=1304137 RepID=UPI00315CBA50
PEVATTTSTIFIATTEPIYTFEPTFESVPCTKKSPLATGGVVIPKKLANPIDLESLSQGVLLSTSMVSNASLTDFFSEYTTKTTIQLANTATSSEIGSSYEEVGNSTKIAKEIVIESRLATITETSFCDNVSSVHLPAGSASSGWSESEPSLSSSFSISEASSSLSQYSSYYSSSQYSSSAYSLESYSEFEVPSSSAYDISSSTVEQNSTSVSSYELSSSEESTSSTPSFRFAPFAAMLAKVVVSNANGFTGDLFKPISTNAVTATFKRQNLPLALPSGVSNGNVAYQTNKFYSNLLVSPQTDTIFAQPFGLSFVNSGYFGFGVQMTLPDRRVFGSQNTNNPNWSSYFFNPIHLNEVIVSSTAFTSSSKIKMNVSGMKVMAVTVKLSTNGDVSKNYVEIPIVQGMGFVTSIYHGNLVPQISSGVGFQKLAQESSTTLNNANLLRYRATLFNGVQYLIYVKIPSGQSISSFKLSVSNNNKIVGSKAIDGLIIQYAIAAKATHNPFYDEAAGMYVTECKVKAHGYGGTSAEYLLAYSTKGTSISGRPIVFALPHHMEVMTSDTSQYYTAISLYSNTHGDMKAYATATMTMTETLNTNVQFLPWTSNVGSKSVSYTSDQLKLIAKTANSELAVDIKTLVLSQNSNYYSGKVLDKYAYILLVVSDIIGDAALTKSTLAILKDTFAQFRNNKQYYPLMYDTRYLGITSTCNNNGDTGADFGSGYYNDHHFHYGYFVHAAAIIGYVDKKAGGTWAKDQQPWVNALIRDVNNPSPADPIFPVFRMFDWFCGHSWAAGLFTSGDGKNEESSSEDYNFAYGLKLWGKVTGNQRMESTGDLMLAVMARAMNKYFLYTKSNTVEPSQIIGNKVSGIIFENKIDYTTYFGTPDKNPEYVHGIHMLPITPASSLIRNPAFVKEEWTDQISGFISKVNSGWTGILRLNQALYDPKSSYSFFSSSSWSDNYLDNGQSRTWSLAFSAGVMNASS